MDHVVAQPLHPTSPPKGKKRAVIDALSEMIAARGLQQGDRLPSELDIARDLSVARSTVREALGAWQVMGIVQRNKGAGTILMAPVCNTGGLSLTLEAESLRRMLEVRRPLEAEAARLAARRADDRARHDITGRMLDLMEVYESGGDWRAADHLFHGAIHRASGNPLFGQLIHQLLTTFDELYAAPFGQAQLGSETIPLHRPFSEAVTGGDEQGAVRLMNEIMDIMNDATRAITKDT
ncbi:FadR/GntR family transcriptional regulator [Oceaniglobus indicus]|uniref:FadR/GntR family transcriptional regulator n=1 Tax=Oceaniglobus indicus TaxID=2047749 RepID=UPI001F4EC444|nr:FCD domain-containing protein [Oceaniglobus indicus]